MSDGTPELGRRSGKEFDQQVERKDLYSDWWWYCAQSGWTLCNPVECSPLGSSVYGIFHARVLKWVAISYSRESCWSRDQIWVSCVSLPVCQWEVPTGDIQLWPGGNLRVSHLWTQGPRPKCLPFVKEEVCRKSGFPHWFSLLLKALRFGFFLFWEKSLKIEFCWQITHLFIQLFCISLHLSLYPFRINTASPTPPHLLQLKNNFGNRIDLLSFCTLNIVLATISKETDPS